MNESYDAYYEAECNAAASEAEAVENQHYEYYLNCLIENKHFALFAAHIASDWLKSNEFLNSDMNALDFIKNKIEVLRENIEYKDSTSKEDF